jgi:hypothetical protein
MLRKKLKVETGKTYTVRDAVSTYTIIVGDVNESDSASASPAASDSSFAVGVGAPSLSLGRSGGVYLDSVSRKIYTKDAIGWDAGFDMGGSSSGLNGSNGRTTLEGSGPTTDSVVYAAALSDAGITASDVQNGDLYLDTLNHVFYKRVSGAWVSRSSHKGLRGRTIFEGSGDPDDENSELPSDISDAAEGDLYHDVVNFKWHRRNSSGIPGSGWDARSAYLGSIGPIGPNGLNGSNGLGGLDGSSGSDGRTTIEGAGPPTNATVYAAALADAGVEAAEVKNGDLYLDTLNHVFYKRASDVWVSRTSHVGRNGKTIFDGSGDPDDASSELPSDIGDAGVGDLYHDVTNFKWYKRNSSGIPGERWDPRNSYKPSELKNVSLTDSVNLAELSQSVWSANTILAAAKEGDTVVDSNNKRIYKRTSTGWEDQGSIAGGKGDKGDGGDNGQDGLDGSDGLPGSNGTGIYSTVLIAESGTPSSNTAYGTTGADDLLIDSTNHKIYKRSASGATFTWALQGTQFRGAAGATGPAAITGYLSNESHTVTANPDGTGYSTTGAGGTFYVNSGSSNVTAQNYYVGASGTSISAIQNKLTLSINSSGVYTLSGGSWDSDSESFTLRAISGSTTVTKTYNIVKNKSSKNLSLVAKALTFSKNGAGSFYPSGQSITFTPQMQNLSSTEIAWTLRKIISGTPTTLTLPNVSYITLVAGSSPYATLTSTQFNSATGGVVGAQLQITAAHADGVEDTVTIGVVSDGSETDIYCAALGTAGSATDQRVPYDVTRGGGTVLRLSDVKADVGGIITAAEATSVSYTSALQSLGNPPTTSYTFTYNVAGVNYTGNVINHRADNIGLTYVPTVFTVAIAGQYRITWQGSFRIRNYDPNNGRTTTCYMSLLKCAAGDSEYNVIEEISASLTAATAGTEQSTPTWTVVGILGSIVRIPASSSKPPQQAFSALTVKDYIGNYNSDYEYTTKVTTLSLSVGDKIMFKARKSSYAIVSYYPEDVYDAFYGTNSLKYRDATEAWINANSTSDDEADKDIDTIVMFQRVAD